MNEKFWTEDPFELFQIKIVPKRNMTLAEKLNILTRYVIVLSFLLGALPTLVALLLIVIFYHSQKTVADKIILNEYGGRINSPTGRINTHAIPGLEPYVSPLTSNQNPYGELTYSAPVYSEEWQINPQTYEDREVSRRPYIDNISYLGDPLAAKPYGQYLTDMNPNVEILRTTDVNFLNSESDKLRRNGSLKEARDYANSNFVKNAVAYRDTMISVHKNRLNRRYLCNSANDTFSPYYSY